MNPSPGSTPRTRVVALRYEKAEMPAPRVTAKGAGELAERLLALARQHDVPVREDPDLLELLATCDLGAEIPSELYHAVAELLVFLQGMNSGKEAAG